MADPLFYILLPMVIFILLNVWDSVTFSDTGVNNAMDALLCPTPEFTGLWNNSGVITRTSQRYNDPDISGNVTLTLTCTPVVTPKGVDYAYGQPTVQFGYFFFIADSLSEGFYKVGQFFFLIGLMLSPPATFTSIVFLLPIIIGMYIFIGYGIYRLATGIISGIF